MDWPVHIYASQLAMTAKAASLQVKVAHATGMPPALAALAAPATTPAKPSSRHRRSSGAPSTTVLESLLAVAWRSCSAHLCAVTACFQRPDCRAYGQVERSIFESKLASVHA